MLRRRGKLPWRPMLVVMAIGLVFGIVLWLIGTHSENQTQYQLPPTPSMHSPAF